jgi:hypothetical protein
MRGENDQHPDGRTIHATAASILGNPGQKKNDANRVGDQEHQQYGENGDAEAKDRCGGLLDVSDGRSRCYGRRSGPTGNGRRGRLGGLLVLVVANGCHDAHND